MSLRSFYSLLLILTLSTLASACHTEQRPDGSLWACADEGPWAGQCQNTGVRVVAN